MYNYHSGLNAEHGFASRWYEWPLIIKPMWYYSDTTLYNTGQMTSIAAFGNPAVWWIGTIAFIWLLVHMFRSKKIDEMQIFILLGFLAQYLPWIPITRSMFIYHYFASIPFIIIMITMMIQKFELKKYNLDDIKTKVNNIIPKRKKIADVLSLILLHRRKILIYTYLVVVIALFVFFYPVIAGMQISSEHGELLKWLPTWWFLY